MKIALENHPEIGYTITPARSMRHKAVKLADTEFADDIALLSKTIEDAQNLLHTVEEVSASVGLSMNESKTKYMAEVIDDGVITSRSGEIIERVNDFLYLGERINSSEDDITVRKAKALAACHKLKKIWKSDL